MHAVFRLATPKIYRKNGYFAKKMFAQTTSLWQTYVLLYQNYVEPIANQKCISYLANIKQYLRFWPLWQPTPF